jgi:hypothetical protein
MIKIFKIFESAKTGLKTISKQKAINNGFFGPVYHGTTQYNWDNIFKEGFKIEYDYPRNTYNDVEYALGYNPPLHHLGFGVYFTKIKAIAKNFNCGSEKNLNEFYLDINNVCEIKYRSKKNMMKWWLENHFDPSLNRVAATKKMTNYLKSKYDAVWFKDKIFYGPSLDGDQIVVFDPKKIYMVDKNLAGKKEIGSKVTAIDDIIYMYNKKIIAPKGMTGIVTNKTKNIRNDDENNWSYGSEYFYTVKWKKGGTTYNILDNQIE